MKTHVDWASLLASEAKTQAVIRADEIAKKHNLVYNSVIAALVRQDRRGLTERVFRNVYLNKLAVGYSSKTLSRQLTHTHTSPLTRHCSNGEFPIKARWV